jgi:hypothetical protein
MESLKAFAEPFEEFLRQAFELGTIPHVDIEFDVWVLKCVRLCLSRSGLRYVTDFGVCSGKELLQGAQCSKIVFNVLLEGYRGRLDTF